MEFQELLVNIFDRIAQVLEKALDGLTEGDLAYQPSPGCNSIAWLAWHLTRVQDSAISSLLNKEQCWIADKWYSKFGRKPDPDDRGVGDSPEDVSNFKTPDAKTILDYHYAVFERTKEYISNLTTTYLICQQLFQLTIQHHTGRSEK